MFSLELTSVLIGTNIILSATVAGLCFYCYRLTERHKQELLNSMSNGRRAKILCQKFIHDVSNKMQALYLFVAQIQQSSSNNEKINSTLVRTTQTLNELNEQIRLYKKSYLSAPGGKLNTTQVKVADFAAELKKMCSWCEVDPHCNLQFDIEDSGLEILVEQEYFNKFIFNNIIKFVILNTAERQNLNISLRRLSGVFVELKVEFHVKDVVPVREQIESAESGADEESPLTVASDFLKPMGGAWMRPKIDEQSVSLCCALLIST